MPSVYHHLSTRKLLVTEWVDGKKLSDCNKDDINKLIAVGQVTKKTQQLENKHYSVGPTARVCGRVCVCALSL